MKRFISIAALLAASAAIALAQPPSGRAKKQPQAAQVVKTTTVTYDTMALTISPTAVAAASDSLLNARFDQLGEKIEQLEKQSNETASRVRKIANQGGIGSTGNFLIKALQNTIPMFPFVAGVLIAIFWFRYSYKKRMIRQEMIYKYIDRGEQVPEWLARAEASAGASTATSNANGTQNPSQTNAKLFLVLSIILASLTLIFVIPLVNANRWSEVFTALVACGAFGFAAIFCFRQYLKRIE